MASLFKRRRGFLLKILVLVPVVYIFSLFVFSADTKRTLPFGDNGIRELLVKRDQNALPDNTEKTNGKIRIEQVVTSKKQIEVNVLNTTATKQEVKHRTQEVKNEHGAEGVVKMDMKAEDVKRSNLRNVQQVVNQVHDPNAPGENGKGINIEKNKLSTEERKKFDDGFKNNAYNQYASDMMSFHRSLPEVREKECLNQKYQANLPETSVVICFHNEAWSVLLRTVHSVIDRTPPHLLKEIILVDDFSDMEHLKKPLEDYIAKLGIVKIARNSKREGLIRSRLSGFSMVQAEVVTFLDSHCECAEGEGLTRYLVQAMDFN